jgi:hypothetical protein
MRIRSFREPPIKLPFESPLNSTGLFDTQGIAWAYNGKSETARPRQFFWGRDCAATEHAIR